MLSATHKITAGIKILPVYRNITVFGKKNTGVMLINSARKGNNYSPKPSALQPFKEWCMPEQPSGYIKPSRHNLL